MAAHDKLLMTSSNGGAHVAGSQTVVLWLGHAWLSGAVLRWVCILQVKELVLQRVDKLQRKEQDSPV